MIKAKNDFIIVYKRGSGSPVSFPGLKSNWDGDIFTNFDDEFVFDGLVYGDEGSLKNRFKEIHSMESSSCGEYSCAHVTDDFVTAHTDSLGANHLYYVDDEFFYVSNSFEMMFNFCKKHIKYTYNFDAYINSIFFGFSFYPTTAINEIKLLNIDEYIKIDRMKKNACIEKRNYFTFMKDIFNKKIEYQDLVVESAKLIKNNTSELINEESDKTEIVLELTGGKDSRIVLAALLSNGFTDFLLHTYGGNSSFDMRFSSLISCLYGLKYVTYEYDMSRLSASRRDYLKSAGVTRLADSGHRSFSKKADFTVLTGTYGEASRSYYAKQLFYSMDKDVLGYGLLDDFTAFYRMFDAFAYRNFVSVEHKKNHSEKCVEFYNKFEFKNNLLMLLDYPLYFSRFRYHFGSMLHNRNRVFYQSYSPTNIFLYHALAYSVSFEDRVNDKNPHSIINELYPPLCFFPHEHKPYFSDIKNKYHSILDLINIPDKCLPIEYKYKKTSNFDREENYINEVENIYRKLIYDNRLSQLIDHKQHARLLLSKNKEKILVDFSALLFFYDFILKN